MANNFTHVMPVRPLYGVLEAEYHTLQRLMDMDRLTAPQSNRPDHQLVARWENGELTLTHKDLATSGFINGLSHGTLQYIGALIERTGADTWEFNVINTCDAPRCDEFDAERVRIDTSGVLVLASRTWSQPHRAFIIFGVAPQGCVPSGPVSVHVTGDDEHDALDQFVRCLYQEVLPAEVVDDEDEVTIDPETGYPWVQVVAMYEVDGTFEKYI